VRRIGVLALALLAAVTASGCFDPFQPHVDPQILRASPHEWTVSEPDREGGGLFSVGRVELEYRFSDGSGAPFPAVLSVLGLRAPSRLDDAEILKRTREFVDEKLVEEGVRADPAQELSGTRTLANGARTEWFQLVGTSGSSSPIFATSREVRGLGEAWYDGRSSTHVIVVALAQTTGPGGLFGSSTVRDQSVWDELVGDPSGSVDDRLHTTGFIYHMVSHA
jgi:hypothetical protein